MRPLSPTAAVCCVGQAIYATQKHRGRRHFAAVPRCFETKFFLDKAAHRKGAAAKRGYALTDDGLKLGGTVTLRFAAYRPSWQTG